MTHPALHRNTLCETVCMKCGDSTTTLVDDEIIAAIPKGAKREIKMLVGCAICKHTQFLLLVPNRHENMMDDMLQGLEM